MTFEQQEKGVINMNENYEDRIKVLENEIDVLKSKIANLEKVTEPETLYQIVGDKMRQHRISMGIR